MPKRKHEHVPPAVMTVKEVAEYLHISPSTVYRMATTRELPGFKLGRESDWRFNIESIDAWRFGKG